MKIDIMITTEENIELIEVMAGSGDLSAYAKTQGYNTTTLDNKQFGNIDWVMDAMDLTLEMLLKFDVAIFWTMCTTYSLAACGHHRNEDYTPKTEFGIFCDKLNTHLVRLCKEAEKINPKFIYYFENPRGVLRKMPFMKGLDRVCITYCSYKDTRMKPTDIWSNNIRDMFNPLGWLPRSMCWNGNKKCQHEAAPRGSKTGTQGLKGNYERSLVPFELIKDIIDQTKSKLRMF